MQQVQLTGKELEILVPWRIVIAVGVLECAPQFFHVLRDFLLIEARKKWDSYYALLESAKGVVVDEETFADYIESAVLSNLTSVDGLLDAVEDMRRVHTEPADGLDGSSETEYFIRQFVANCDAVSFEVICLIFEKVQIFIYNRYTGPSTKEKKLHAAFESHQKALEENDVTAAEDAMHRYFDLALVHLGGQVADSASDFAAGAQYASICLAATRQKFGHKEEAVAALTEAINVAQQIGDEDYQSIAAGWLAEIHGDWRFLSADRGSAEAELALVRQEIITLGLGRSPDERLKRIRKHVSAATTRESSSDAVAAAGLLFLAAAWLFEGGRAVALSLSRLAHQRLLGKPSQLLDRATAAVQMLVFESGDPLTAIDTLVNAYRESKEPQVLLSSATYLTLQLALAKGEVRVAEALVRQVTAMKDKELELLGHLAGAETLLCKRDFVRADRLAAEVLETAAGERRTAIVVEAMLIRAEAHLAAGSAPSALPPVLSALSFATSLHNKPQRCRAMGLLARVHLGLGQPSDAIKSIRSALHASQSSLPCRQRGKQYLTHAQCMVESNPMEYSYSEIRGALKKALSDFERSHDLRGTMEGEMLLARAANMFSHQEERDQAAKRSRLCSQQLTHAAKKSPAEAMALLYGSL